MKKILYVGESSFLSTGYAIYANKLLSGLHNTGKYDIMELGCYGRMGDERANGIPWKFIGNNPNREKPQEQQAYDNCHFAEFGEWRFEDCCLIHKPDIVIDIRDPWHMEFQFRSPFRPYFSHVIMPTVDAIPLKEQWVAGYLSADSVLAYTDWGLDVLKEVGRGKIKTASSAPAGVDLDIFNVPKDKAEHRNKMGIDPNALIIGTTMRNQRRKLFPDLIEAFAKFLKEAPEQLRKRTYLYLHTAWPDLGWDIPQLIKENGVGHKTLFTYLCHNCGSARPHFFQDYRAFCKNCGQPAATFASSMKGVSRETLADITKLFDVFVQYAIAEGQGIPQVEAAACGVHVMSVDYSGMSDVVRKLNGTPISVERYFREVETHRKMALPNNSDLVQKLIKYLSLPNAVRQKKGWDARKGAEQHYSWDKTIKIWDDCLSSIETIPYEKTWGSPRNLCVPKLQIPDGLTNDEFVRWGMINIAGRPDLINSFLSLELIRDLNWASTLGYIGGYHSEESTPGSRPRFQEFNREQALNIMNNLREQKNYWEMRRI